LSLQWLPSLDRREEMVHRKAYSLCYEEKIPFEIPVLSLEMLAGAFHKF